jgi:hypothetical protein
MGFKSVLKKVPDQIGSFFQHATDGFPCHTLQRRTTSTDGRAKGQPLNTLLGPTMLCLDYDVIACHNIFFETTEKCSAKMEKPYFWYEQG